MSWRGFILLLLPITLDGGTYAISDLAGIGEGFRGTNQWLIALTNNLFPATVNTGAALGSFNTIMRLVTGVLARLGIVWLGLLVYFPNATLIQELDNFNYEKVIEQIKDKNPDYPG